MLWSLRNKLVLTYLLIGLAPVVLFVTLALVSAYVAAGQFAIHLAETRMQTALSQMSGRMGIARSRLRGYWMEGRSSLRYQRWTGRRAECSADEAAPRHIGLCKRNADSRMGNSRGRTPLGLPAWATELPGGEFQGLVLDGDDPYLVAVHQQRLNDGRMLSHGQQPAGRWHVMDMVSEGLGRAQLYVEKLAAAKAS